MDKVFKLKTENLYNLDKFLSFPGQLSRLNIMGLKVYHTWDENVGYNATKIKEILKRRLEQEASEA